MTLIGVLMALGFESTSRMRQSALSFVQWVLRMADDNYVQLMAPILFSGLLKLLAALKQPEAQDARELYLICAVQTHINSKSYFSTARLNLLCHWSSQ